MAGHNKRVPVFCYTVGGCAVQHGGQAKVPDPVPVIACCRNGNVTGYIVTAINSAYNHVVCCFSTVYVHQRVAVDVGHTGTAVNSCLQVASLKVDVGSTYQLGLVTAAIHVLYYSTSVYFNITASKHQCAITVARSKQTSVYGAFPVRASYLSGINLNICAAKRAAFLSAAEYRAYLTGVYRYVSGFIRSISYCNTLFCRINIGCGVAGSYCTLTSAAIDIALDDYIGIEGGGGG